MREKISVPSVVLGDESFAPAAPRALLRASSCPGDHDQGMLRMRGPRLADALGEPNPSEHRHLDRENTTTMEGSLAIAASRYPPLPPPALEALAYQARRVVREILESSTQKHALLRDLSGVPESSYLRLPDR